MFQVLHSSPTKDFRVEVNTTEIWLWCNIAQENLNCFFMASTQYLYDNNTTATKQKQSDSIERWRGNRQMNCKTIKKIKFVLTVDVHSQNEITVLNMAWFIFSSARFKIGWQTLPIPLTTVHMIFGKENCAVASVRLIQWRRKCKRKWYILLFAAIK